VCLSCSFFEMNYVSVCIGYLQETKRFFNKSVEQNVKRCALQLVFCSDFSPLLFGAIDRRSCRRPLFFQWCNVFLLLIFWLQGGVLCRLNFKGNAKHYQVPALVLVELRHKAMLTWPQKNAV
jgi:hypothetical protein